MSLCLWTGTKFITEVFSSFVEEDGSFGINESAKNGGGGQDDKGM